jgi:hypothetical protein
VIGRAVAVQPDVVTKRQDPRASRRERLRTLAGRKVGQETGLFIVPEVLSHDDERGEIVFERLHLTGLRPSLSDPTQGMELAGAAARALGAIHDRMETGDPDAAAGSIAANARRRGVVPVHGDFGIANVRYHPPSAGIALIDWSNADWTGVEGDLAPPETDVAVFLISLFHRRLFDPTPIRFRRKVARHFLTTYASVGPQGLDMERLREVVRRTTPAFVRLTRQLKGTVGGLAYRHGLIDLSWFLRRLSQDGLTSQNG